MEKSDVHQLAPVWMTVCLAPKQNFKKSIDKSRGVHIRKRSEVMDLGVNGVAVGQYGLILGPNEAHGLQEAF